jgi:hypothetical protein
MFNSLQDIFDYYDAWAGEMTEIVDTDKGYAELLDCATRFLGCPVSIVDDDFTIIAFAGGGDFRDADARDKVSFSIMTELLSDPQFSKGLYNSDVFEFTVGGEQFLSYNYRKDSKYLGRATLYFKSSLSKKIMSIKRAIADSKLITFDYYSEKGQSCRRIEPYCIIFQWSSWYVFGYCLERGDFRLFKLNRLYGLTVLAEVFAPREIPPGSLTFEDRFPDEHRIVVLFEPSALYQLVDSYGRECFTEQPDGFLRFEFGYTNRSYMVNWILGFGDKAKVLEPSDMAEEILNIAKKMVDAYNEHDKLLSCSSGIMEEKKEEHS